MEGVSPDLYLILMMPVEVFLERRKEKKEQDRIEQETRDFFERAIQGYNDFIKENPKKVTVFDATLSIEEIHEQIVERVKKLLK